MAKTAGQGPAPYRAEAIHDGEKWHLGVQSLDDHPDRGEVDAVVVTVTPQDGDAGFPARDLDRTLGRCGFARGGEWTRETGDTGAAREAGEGERWTAPCRQADPQAAPGNTPPRD